MLRARRAAAAATVFLSLPLGITALGLSTLLISTAGCGGGQSVSDTSSPSDLPSRYVVSEITTLPYRATFVDRNKDGYMLARNYTGTDSGKGLIVAPDGTVTVITAPDGTTENGMMAINNQGQAVGTNLRSGVGFVYDIRTGKASPINGLSSPIAINDSGKVVGTDGFTSATRKGVVYDIATGTLEELPKTTIPADIVYASNFEPMGINNAGLVIGTLFRDTAIFDVNTKSLKRVSPTPNSDFDFSLPEHITDNGKIAIQDRKGDSLRNFIYDVPSGVKTPIPNEPRSKLLINSSGTVVMGFSDTLSIYRNGQMRQISAALSAEDRAKWAIQEPFAIDDNGVIYAEADVKGDSDTLASTIIVQLTPQ